jgi:hypothetical protein
MLVQVGCSWIICREPPTNVAARYMVFWNAGRSLGILILQIVFSVLCLFPKIVSEAKRETFLNVWADFSLLRAADRYAYTLWKHCLLPAIYLGNALILIDIRRPFRSSWSLSS